LPFAEYSRKTAANLVTDLVHQFASESGEQLPVRATAAAHVATLPLPHRDPFDRLLVAQAVIEPAILYTADPQLEVYSELVQRIQ
jgi:PIN domain nuclease of toxin-antitoxin system